GPAPPGLARDRPGPECGFLVGRGELGDPCRGPTKPTQGQGTRGQPLQPGPIVEPGTGARSPGPSGSSTAYSQPGSRPLCRSAPPSSSRSSLTSDGWCEKASANARSWVTVLPGRSSVSSCGEPWNHDRDQSTAA